MLEAGSRTFYAGQDTAETSRGIELQTGAVEVTALTPG